MDIDFSNLEFDINFRPEILKQTKKICKDEYTIFSELMVIFSDIDKFLIKKSNNNKIKSKEDYVRIIYIRIKDHFSSSIILVSQGYTVDAMTLIRSAYEDLFLLLNFYLNEKYFEKWLKNDKTFKIKPVELRTYKFIEKNDQNLFNKIYKNLCNILHPKINSIHHMSRCHPTYKNGGSEGINRIKKDINLINISFYMCSSILVKQFRKQYTNDMDKEMLENISKNLEKIYEKYNLI